MSNFLSQAEYPVAGAREQPSPYPLQRRFFKWGLWAAILAGLLFQSPLVGFSFLVVFWATALVWRIDELPVLAFIIAFQWLFVVSGYVYREVYGFVPGFPELGDFDGAVLLSMLGFLALAAGIRTGFHLLGQRVALAERRVEPLTPRYNVRSLFWLVIAVYTINWFVAILPGEIFFNAAEIIATTLQFRAILLSLLFLVIVRQKEGYVYGAGALLYVLAPMFGDMHAKFVDPLLMLFIALLGEWRPWSKSIWARRRARGIMWSLAVFSGILFAMALIWIGGVRPEWRPMHLSGQVSGTPVEKAEVFLSILERGVPLMDWQEALGELVGRMSGVLFFSYVLERVPEVVPHENGWLTLRALQHSFLPRILFPDKAVLRSDSWLIRDYAGLEVAGEEAQTSIGLGYMPEFYIDYGAPGMFVGIFLYGIAIGLLYMGLFLISSRRYFSSAAVTVMYVITFLNYDGALAKQLGAMNMNFIVFGFFLGVLGPRLHRMCAERRRTGLGPVASSMRSREATNDGLALTDV